VAYVARLSIRSRDCCESKMESENSQNTASRKSNFHLTCEKDSKIVGSE
jgi:hypothetical protein